MAQPHIRVTVEGDEMVLDARASTGKAHVQKGKLKVNRKDRAKALAEIEAWVDSLRPSAGK